jgi:hypothetical protein
MITAASAADDLAARVRQEVDQAVDRAVSERARLDQRSMTT